MIEEFLEYASRLDPGFRTRIRGADRDQINALERAAGQPLPRHYREFLQQMGWDSGRLEVLPETHMDPDALLTFYQEEIASGWSKLPPGTILIGVGRVSAPNVCLQPQDEIDGPVVSVDGDEVLAFQAGSLEKLLYRRAFGELRIARAAHQRTVAGLREEFQLADLLHLVSGSGLDVESFSDDLAVCLSAPDSAVLAQKRAGECLMLRLAAASDAAAEKLACWFHRILGK